MSKFSTLVLAVFTAITLMACNVSDEEPRLGNSDTNNSNNSSANNCDACGVCDDDPDNDCEVDCAGTPGGTATEDACGVCDEDPDNDCVIDCAGDPGGDAYEDECGVCDAEPQNDCQPDCAGTFGGDAYEDLCGVCDADPSNDCAEDCEGVPNGPAILDFCGRCTGGTTGRLPCTVIDVPVTEDATIDSDNAGTNLGTEVSVNTESDTSYGLFKYDLTNIAEDDIVYNAEVIFTAVDGEARSGDGTTYVEALTSDSWSESDVTWDTQPSDEDLETVGTFDASTATTGDQVFSFASDQLAGHVAREAAGNGQATIRLRTPGFKVRFASKDGPTTSLPSMRVGVVKAREAIIEPTAGATIENGSMTAIESVDRYQVVPDSVGPERGMLLQFDLGSLPGNAQIERVFISATAAGGFAYGGDGNVYTFFVENDSWDESTVTGAELGLSLVQPMKSDNLGSWWLWYNSTPGDKVGLNGSLKLVPVVQQELTNDRVVSFFFGSSGYRTEYYTRSNTDAALRPKIRILYTLPGQ